MKILLLCKKFPYPLKDGESIAIHNLSTALAAQGCELSILAMNTSKHFFQGTDYPVEMQHFQKIETIEIDNRLKPTDAIKNLFSNDSYHITRFVSDAFRLKLKNILQQNEYDVIQLETLYLAPYVSIIRRYSNAKISMRAHNVEHEIWDRIATNTNNPIKRWYLQHLTAKLKEFEVQSLNTYDLLIPITKRDLKYFQKLGSKTESVVIPIGVSYPNFPQNPIIKTNQKISISFIGSLDWTPNTEGLNWFISNVWPAIHKAFPGIELHIAGRNTPKYFFDLNKPNIFVHGEVPESVPFINKHDLMVVPLLSGSGMRAKILEGMALGKTILTTSIGLEGIHASDKEEVLIANTTQEFVESLRYVLKSPERLERIGKQANTFVFNHYDHIKVGKRLYDAYASQIVATV